MSTKNHRRRRRLQGLPNWRLVRYADDAVILTDGTAEHLEDLREDITRVLAPMGLRLSQAKTQIVHMRDGFDYLGFHIRWKRKRGSSKWYVYTFIAKRPLESVKAKIRALTRRRSQQPLADVLEQINRTLRGWTNYFRHAAAKRTFGTLDQFTWHRVVNMIRYRHRWTWKQVRRWLRGPHGRWQSPHAGDVVLFNPVKVPVTRYRYRGQRIAPPWAAAT